jgi:hypothetical protein
LQFYKQTFFVAVCRILVFELLYFEAAAWGWQHLRFGLLWRVQGQVFLRINQVCLVLYGLTRAFIAVESSFISVRNLPAAPYKSVP